LQIIKYYINGSKIDKDKVIRGYDFTREGARGAKSFYYILFTHLVFNGEKRLHELPEGKAMWF
jgi:hypothetical protein